MMNEEDSDMTVFVIDDDDDARKALARLVRSAGWHVEAYGAAHDFLGRLPYSGVGCVLLDVQMPGMTGPQLQARMLESGVSLPIVFLTGHADVPMSVDAMKQGALDVLQKPADDTSIMQAIGAALARHERVSAADRERNDVSERIAKLSPREREVMECVISGRLNKQIAGDLGITEKTVKAHRARVMEKLETRSVASLVRLCALAGIAPRDYAAGHERRDYPKQALGSF